MVFYIVIFSSVVTLVLTAMQLRLEFNYGIQSLHQQIYQIEATNLDSINRSLWTMNHSALQTQLDGLKRLNDIVYIKIVDTNNKLIAAAGEINTDNTITKNFILQHDYRDKKNQLGTLVVVATKENVYQHLIDTVIVILISQAIKTFIVSLFILFLFYYLVTRHLEKISQHSEKHNL